MTTADRRGRPPACRCSAAKLHILFPREEGPLVPQFPKCRRGIGLDAACGLQGLQIPLGQIGAVNLQARHVEDAARQAEGFIRIDDQAKLGQAVVSAAALRSA